MTFILMTNQEENIRIEFYKKGKMVENIQAYINGKIIDNKGHWIFKYIDKKNNTYLLQGYKKTLDKNRINLYTLLELMKWLNDPTIKKNVTVHTNSMYVFNCIQEWLYKW